MPRHHVSILRLALSFSGAVLLLALSTADASAQAPSSATGSVKADWGTFQTNLAFHVQAQAEGAKGHANILIFSDESKPLHVTLDLDCLRIELDNIAVVSGTVLTSESEADFEPGDTVIFVVRDNGEGGEAMDQVSPIFSLSEYVPDACELFFIAESVDVVGNVQVNP